ALLLILGAHESAHFLTSRRHGVRSTLPLFIPAPTLVGTFGAVIRIESPIPDRRSLLEIGLAGPLAGFLVALPLGVAGLRLSHVALPVSGGDGAATGLGLGSSLVFTLLERAVLGPLPGEASLVLHPVAFAAWIGFFVTAINLLPIGQLDGGHVLYALTERRQEGISRGALLALAPLGFLWWGWFLWGGVLLLMGLRHPPVFAEESTLGRREQALGVLAAGLLILTLAPAPFTM
ncbi:MAG TPA: site-2 protease family protein, partial [Candidatus Methanoperedens sp.]|nr:site-2 protease family protein [Candidatus Methanoperedens sp.]